MALLLLCKTVVWITADVLVDKNRNPQTKNEKKKEKKIINVPKMVN